MKHTFLLARALGLAAASLLALGACQGAEPAPEAVGASSQALCSAEQHCPDGTVLTCSDPGVSCVANEDANGLYVECGGARTYCGAGAPACVCGAAKQEAASAWGATCGGAYQQAKKYALAQSDCPTRICSSSFAFQECWPVSGNRDDGFEADIIVTYTCKEPANCQ